jgi:hypothetical protein
MATIPTQFPPSFVEKETKLFLPKTQDSRIDNYVQTRSGSKQGDVSVRPFERKIDIWFAAIAWAAHKGLEPANKSGSSRFVSLGPKQAHIGRFEPYRGELLVALAVRDFGTESKDSQDITKVIGLANRYAQAGIGPLLDALDEQADLYSPALHTAIDFFVEALETSAS